MSLLDFCKTPRESSIVALYEAGLSGEAIAKKLEADGGNIRRAIRLVKARAAVKGYAPEHDMVHTVADNFKVQGTSTLYRNGVPMLQWVKTSLDEDQRKSSYEAFLDEAHKELQPILPIKAPKLCKSELLNQYIFTDCHVGMLATIEGSGANWNLEIAERILYGCFEQMITSAPKAKECIIVFNGDWFHQDSIRAVTPTHQHELDSADFWDAIVRAAYRIVRRIIDLALSTHEFVYLVIGEGNHDISSSSAMRATFSMLYEKEPRLKLDGRSIPFYAHKHGKVMLGFHHGHKVKNDALPLLFAAMFPKIWGETTKRYGHTGHRHHVDEKEHTGIKIMQHPTLAAPDRYATTGGWISEREATALTYHKDFGLVGRTTVTPEMIAI